MPRRSNAVAILVADDHAVVREGLRSILRGNGLAVVAEAESGRAAVQLAADHQPDVVLMDVRMPDMDGLAAISGVKRAAPAAAIVMLSLYDDLRYKLRAVAAGAAGYLLKGLDEESLREAVRRAAAGETLVDRAAVWRDMRQMVRTPQETAPERPGGVGRPIDRLRPQLTQREAEILALVAEGLTNREIGELLLITEGTARAHVHNIIAKLGVSDRTRAAVWAVRRGLVA